MPAVIDASRCEGCGACIPECKGGAIHLNGSVAYVDEDACMECGACVRACPNNAISVEW
ncbi:indolepyruvate ferredoxin oxidoreductase subunit alpha [Archaeoglobus sp.]